MQYENYMICDGNGDALCQGLQGHEAEQIAQRTANEKGESVWLYAEGGPGDPDADDLIDTLEGQEFTPRNS